MHPVIALKLEVLRDAADGVACAHAGYQRVYLTSGVGPDRDLWWCGESPGLPGY